MGETAIGRTGETGGKVVDGRAKNSARRGHGLPKVVVRAGFEPRRADGFSHSSPIKASFRFVTVLKSTRRESRLKTGADAR
jgi:hypothetical protein